ncbi:MAG: TetR/AcrR family transcriptional regulator, partial [Oligoflexus sp.]
MPTERFERLDTARMAQILSVALDEFARHRYQDASFNRIIKNCGMAKGTMYYYFNSKEDLFMTLYKATVREFTSLNKLALRSVQSPGEYWALAHELLDSLWLVLRFKPTSSIFVTNFLNRSSRKESHPAAETIEAIDQWLHSFVSQGQRLGAIRSDLEVALLVSLLWGTWEGYRDWMPGLKADRA